MKKTSFIIMLCFLIFSCSGTEDTFPNPPKIEMNFPLGQATEALFLNAEDKFNNLCKSACNPLSGLYPEVTLNSDSKKEGFIDITLFSNAEAVYETAYILSSKSGLIEMNFNGKVHPESDVNNGLIYYTKSADSIVSFDSDSLFQGTNIALVFYCNDNYKCNNGKWVPLTFKIILDEDKSDDKRVDTHNHLVGWIGRGPNQKFDYTGPAENAIKIMEENDIGFNIISPMPQVEEQQRRLRFEDISPLIEKYPSQFGVLGGGGSLNVIIHKTESNQVSEAVIKNFRQIADEIIENGAIGFGEMAAEHLSMRSGHPYLSVSPNHPLFLELSKLASKHNVPIDIHMEAIPTDMPLPSHLDSSSNPEILKANIPSFEELLSNDRGAKIVWAHLGWDNTGRRTVQLTRELLQKHSNLYLSIRVPNSMQAENVNQETLLLDVDGKVKIEWFNLFEDFSDRFIIGSDEIIMDRDDYPGKGSMSATLGLINQLPNDLKLKFTQSNPKKIYNLN